MDIFDQIKQSIDLAEYVGRTIALRKSGRHYVGFCPFHTNTNTPALTIFPDTQSFHCFGCKAGGSIIDFVKRTTKGDMREVIVLLATEAGIDIPDQRQEDVTADHHSFLHDLLCDAVEYWRMALWSDAGLTARAYMHERGISDATMQEWTLGFAPDDWGGLVRWMQTQHPDRDVACFVDIGIAGSKNGRVYDLFRNRIMFPICDMRGRIISMGGRAIGDSMPKYLNGPQTVLFDKKNTLFGFHHAKQAMRKQGTAIIVEGFIDTLAAHQHGIRNTVAIMGTALSSEHLQHLHGTANRIVLSLDQDTAGQKAMMRSIEVLRRHMQTTEHALLGVQDWGAVNDTDMKIALLPTGSDPASLLQQSTQWQDAILAAVPAVEYVVTTLTHDVADTDKAEALHRILPLLTTLPQHSISQQRLVRLVSERLTLPPYMIYHAMPKVQQTSQALRQSFVLPPTNEQRLLATLFLSAELYNVAQSSHEQTLSYHPTLQCLLQGQIVDLFQLDMHRVLWQLRRDASEPDVTVWAAALDEPMRSYAISILQHNSVVQEPELLAPCLFDLQIKCMHIWVQKLTHAPELIEACIAYEQCLRLESTDYNCVPSM